MAGERRKPVGFTWCGDVLLGLGANVAGRWGAPSATLACALAEMARHRIEIVAVSSLYRSPPMGAISQPDFINCVAAVRTHLPAEALLEVLKRIDRAAGRRAGLRWGPRPLDADILDYKGLRRPPVGSAGAGVERIGRRLTLPHLGIAERIFVLAPLAEIAPFWHHPVSGSTPTALIARLPATARRIIRLTPGNEIFMRLRNACTPTPKLIKGSVEPPSI